MTDQSNILELLNRSTSAESSDPRDRIYGLLGMSDITIGASDGLVVDYETKRPVDVYKDLMIYLIHRYGLVRMLYLDTTFGGKLDEDELPSWVIDWRRSTGWLQDPLRSPWEDLSFLRLREFPKTQIDSACLAITGDTLQLWGECVGVIVSQTESRVHSRDVGPDRPKSLLKAMMKKVRSSGARAMGRTSGAEAEAEAVRDGPEPEHHPRPLGSRKVEFSEAKRVAVQMRSGDGWPDYATPKEFYGRFVTLWGGQLHPLDWPSGPGPFWKASEDSKEFCSMWVAPMTAQAGDEVVLSPGSPLPLILRPVALGGSSSSSLRYRFVGPTMFVGSKTCMERKCSRF
ncbi:Uu.00g064550.m01.CDS01 [Anthostomella pinea]|uniref:Uu.00g064550.m01.CDS01 n=1 Tax=Anthostomella pinea TaxID=933095 RepID=A0AAI8VUE6_9PEZI|nr:Uu.00g064550.m01.CDS01 [Anthostomella pinea]